MKPPLLPLSEHLLESPFDFDFFQAVRLLGLLLPGRAPVGDAADPKQELVRFSSRQSLEFPASAIHSLETESDPAVLTVAFMGLTGVQGVLPHHYTEYIIARAANKDYAMAAFFDLFNHRLLSLFYRAWEKYRMPALYQANVARRTGQDRFTTYLYDLIGMGTGGLHNRMSVHDEGLLRYAGLLTQAPKSASVLASILRDYFAVPVEIDEFIGEWHLLEEDELCNLAQLDGRNELGDGAITGDAVWDPHARFRVRLGPLALHRFLEFLPDGSAVSELVDLVRLIVGEVLQFEWQPVLDAEEVPWCRLGDESESGPRVGLCAWLKAEEFSYHATDAVFAAA